MSEWNLPHDHGPSTLQNLESVPAVGEFETIAELCKLLGDSSRAKLFWLLCHCEECVINLSAMMGMSSPAVSHHLKLLKSAKLIISRREGKEVYYRAADTETAELLHRMMEHMICVACPGR